MAKEGFEYNATTKEFEKKFELEKVEYTSGA